MPLSDLPAHILARNRARCSLDRGAREYTGTSGYSEEQDKYGVDTLLSGCARSALVTTIIKAKRYGYKSLCKGM